MQQLQMWGGNEITCFKDKTRYGELNLEKSAKIFFPPLSSGDPQLKETAVKKLESFTITNGADVTAVNPYIEIIPPKNGERYNTDTHDVLYALYRQWELAGSPEKPFQITLAKTAKLMGQSTGQDNLTKIKDALHSLYSTEIHFNACFELQKGDQHGCDDELETRRFRILNIYDTKNKRQQGKVRFGTARIAFHTDLLESLIAGKRIPVNFVQRMSIRHKVSRAIYGVYDTYLTSQYGKTPGKVRREIRIENLLREFNQPEQPHKSKRKRMAESIAKNIDGAELSKEGLYMSVSAEETSDRKDYKLVFKVVGEAKTKTQRVTYIHNDEVIDGMMAAAVDIIGPVRQLDTKSLNSLRASMRKTPREMVFAAISETREEIRNKNRKIDSVPAYIQAIMKRKLNESKQR